MTTRWMAVPATLLLGLAIALGVVACKQAEGERCQSSADCDTGLTCNLAKDPPVCQLSGTGGGIDALPPIDAEIDAPPPP
jgi:hypothetical protein